MPSWLNQEIIYFYSVPFFIAVIVLELLFSNLRGLRLYSWRDSLTSATFALTNLSLDMLFKGLSFALLGWSYSHRVFDWGAHTATQQLFWYWILLLILQDFAYWAQHTVDHSSRLFWAIHSTHHNSEQYNLTTGFRSSVLQPLYRFVYFMPLAWLGFLPLHIMFVYSVTQIYGNLVHTQLIGKMGILEKFMVTPSHHRVHHASNTPYLDKNMGMLFIAWDKLFGTFEEEGRDPEPVRYGTVSSPQKRDPWSLFSYEFKNIWRDIRMPNLTPWQRFCYVFAPPGWSHDGRTQTAKQMQHEWNAQHPKLKN